MDKDDRSITKILDSIESKLNNLSTNLNSSSQSNSPTNDDLVRFIKTSKKEHYWWGQESEFNKAKKINLIVFICFLCVSLVLTILSTITFRLYSTFTFFENISLLFIVITFVKSTRLKKRMIDTELAENSNTEYILDADGTMRNTNKEKKRYKWTRRLSYIAAVGNIIAVWTTASSSLSIAVTIFELAYISLTIAYFLTYINVTCMYGNFIFFTNKKINNDDYVTIVFDTIRKKLLSFEEFKNTYEKY